MSRIHLRRSHDLTAKAARQRVNRMAEALGRRFDAECSWRDDVLSIEHPNVSGTVTIEANEIVVEATLGFLLALFRDRVDEELVRILDAEFPEGNA
ncbi:MAG TPA: polyhydroxyalkanoic acid system family protein [Steroidobacteraceae bacterium]|nr:polyhydroxyalkanoic acid system family protein [Steroidobacteraceae bacterium]